MPNFIISKFVFFTLLCKPGPPSAPRNAISNVNETSVFLEWIPPADTGGRKDVSYYIACKKCNSHAGVCDECGGHVRYLPQQIGLKNTSVMVVDGEGKIACGGEELQIPKGDSLFMPADSGKFTLDGSAKVLITRVGTI